MPKTSRAQAFFDVKPEPPKDVTLAGDLAIIWVKIDNKPLGDRGRHLAEQETRRGLQKLSDFLKRGWVHLSSTSYTDIRYTTIAYTLKKPPD